MASVKAVANLVKIAFFLLLEAPFRPRWAYYRLRGYAYHYVLNQYHRNRLAAYGCRKQPLAEALASITGRGQHEVETALTAPLLQEMKVQRNGSVAWVVEIGQNPETAAGGPIPVFYGPSPELAQIVYTVCRLTRPNTVVETGVARGFTSTAALAALDENGTGHLYSVELPSLYIGYTRQVGELIPPRLRHRWSLELGPSAIVLPRLMKALPPIDVFIHDSAANYDNQSTEYRIALEHMAPGGILISDMLDNDAFAELGEPTGYPWVVIQQSKAPPIGVLRKA